jgi:hypothetical protein
LDSITIGQLIDYFEREFPTVRQQQQHALFGITVQRADTVGSYYTKLKKIARLANMGDDEFRRRFIGVLHLITNLKYVVWDFTNPLMKYFLL